jgi:glyoxylase-like metal-dependent hydrolase (beta-lactamase superfamily II)
MTKDGALWTTGIGAMQVQRVEEMLTPGFDPAFLFPDYDPAVLTEHPELAAPEFFHAASGKLMSSMQSWLLRAGKEIIIVDTGCGNDKIRENAAFQRFHRLNLPFLKRLAAYGVQPEDVTMVINTHLHVDHVGWNTRLVDGRWTPTFPRARYLMGRHELAHWRDPAGGPLVHPWGVPVIADSVDPVIDAGLVELMDDGDTILPGVTVQAVPGHTAGQLAIWLHSEGASAAFTADVFHQPMQIARPGWNSCFCEVPDSAIATRRRLFETAADTGAVLFPSHTGAPHAGRVARAGDGFRFVPLPLTR